MSVSVLHLGYKRLSRAIFEWQAADRTALLAVFILMEVFLHWLWCAFVWWYQDALGAYVYIHLLYPLWLGITVMGVFFWGIVRHLSRLKRQTTAIKNKNLNKWQLLLVVPYTFYIATVIVMVGYSSLFAGVSLVGGAMLGMMLIKRRYAWRVFLLQIALILLAILAPYCGIHLPNLRQLTFVYPFLDSQNYLTYNELMAIENTLATSVFKGVTLDWSSISELQRSSTFFWRATHVLLALPKAIFIVYMFRTLLLILDDSKNEILKHANQDELTQLKNRRYGLTQMKQALKELQDGQDFSVILLDLDWFKDINDTYGHEVGDQVLFEVAQTLTQALTDAAIVSRYGGEEFLIVLPATSHDGAMLIAEQLRKDISKHIIKVDDNEAFSVTASLGLYTFTHEQSVCMKQARTEQLQLEAALQPAPAGKPRHHRSALPPEYQTLLPPDICQRLICTADKALYEAKDRGRDQVVSANHMFFSENSRHVMLCGI